MNRKQADGVWIGKKKNKKHTNRNRKHRQDKEEYTNWRTRQTVLYVLQMCKHAAHTTDDENSWIEYFFVQHEQGASLTFPALSAHVQDGRRGKVSAIAKKKKKKKKPGNPTHRYPTGPPQSASGHNTGLTTNSCFYSPGKPCCLVDLISVQISTLVSLLTPLWKVWHQSVFSLIFPRKKRL